MASINTFESILAEHGDKNMPSIDQQNKDLFDTSNVTNETAKAYIENVKAQIETQNAISLNRRMANRDFDTAILQQQCAALTEKQQSIKNHLDEIKNDLDVNALSKDDYEAVLNATCAANNGNTKGGFTECAKDTAITHQLLSQMSPDEITASIQNLSPRARQEWLESVLQNNPQLATQTANNLQTLNEYADEAKAEFIDRDPRIDPTNMRAITNHLCECTNEVHEKHTCQQSDYIASDRQRREPVAQTTSRFDRPIQSMPSINLNGYDKTDNGGFSY